MDRKYIERNYGYDAPHGNFFLLPNNIFGERLSHAEFVVFAYLVMRKNLDNECWPSRANIAEETNTKSVRTVDKCLKELEDRCLIEKINNYDHSKHLQLSNRYIINKFDLE